MFSHPTVSGPPPVKEAGSVNRIPVVLVHGAWLHISSWHGWTERFTAHGYDVRVPAWPPGGFGLDELTAHYEKAVRSLDAPPVVIGHSAGGLIARQLLDDGLARAAVAIAPLPLPLPLPVPGAGREIHCEEYVPLPQARFRHLVANAVGEDEAATLFDRYVVPAPHGLLADLGFDGTTPGSFTDTSGNTAGPEASTRGPLLLISGQEDRMVADAVTRDAYKRYGDSTAITDLKQFADRGHSLVIDSGWPAVADYVLAWLAANGMTTPAEAG
jgi:non-heme chloroperoxidase